MTKTASIHSSAELLLIRDQVILRLPAAASDMLPSRGQVAVRGTINGQELRTMLEPDGYSGHWMRLDAALRRAVGAGPGDTVTLDFVVSKDWPEPESPEDLASALRAAPQKVQEKWKAITSMARWEWVRWVNETRNPDTRAVRIEKTISKLNGNHRRPCCFNLAACTDAGLSKSGKLAVEP
ncbi:MAG TPA: YdeI/OmpD-associated family protein [Chthonomonadales bacterium]|nr:YdeI/OmpD-associated family protein [Chthonomonadales bacterium]